MNRRQGTGFCQKHSWVEKGRKGKRGEEEMVVVPKRKKTFGWEDRLQVLRKELTLVEHGDWDACSMSFQSESSDVDEPPGENGMGVGNGGGKGGEKETIASLKQKLIAANVTPSTGFQPRVVFVHDYSIIFHSGALQACARKSTGTSCSGYKM